ncbi:membrane protein OxaA [Thermacetogenium phaeum DSM 12270]|uniref:Membrane protein OxaA n=1 Tax=Thermacetogenium phaeum (strain ATCC BAA-254 / DSM 26808 / PB) TaxID=1089553 RepID=K4LE06_THEPS|nr:YidC/Oxa1 family membrane protein insertase [Thermacetogenium phaeum]AFV10277.1 membrane protein OxaA [Thermacetogenium phaeum DSM 12270]
MWNNIVQGFSEIIQAFYLATVWMKIPSYGLAIILFTIAVKIVLFPLTRLQMNSMRAMQELQPKIKEIQERYKNKPEKAQQAVMQLYKEKGVNPMSGCLPLLIQMPIIFALFSSLRLFFDPKLHPPYVDLTKAGFLWIENLGQPDPIILPLLTVVVTFAQQFFTSMTASGKIDPTQRTMLIIMPLFIGWIARTLPAGLTLYWVVFSLFSAVETLVIRRMSGVAKGAGSKA